ncbi:translation initiation factor IF-2-like [Prionailurus bengalensis]|uniref:translation initiation factor IF-2-like n=1 Tax=Prionailurus bengalensis TaxID=37029 RepID=UPI001CAA33FC|nr:translation initiation factor IF-2-like [Prionailurus bengalensis]
MGTKTTTIWIRRAAYPLAYSGPRPRPEWIFTPPAPALPPQGLRFLFRGRSQPPLHTAVFPVPSAHAPLRPILSVCCELGSAQQPPPPPQPRARTEPGSRELGTWNSKPRPAAPPTAAPAPPHPPHGRPAAGWRAGFAWTRRPGGSRSCRGPGPARPASGTGARASSRERAGHRAATAGQAPARGKPGKSREPAPAATSVVPGQRGPSRPSSAALSRHKKR